MHQHHLRLAAKSCMKPCLPSLVLTVKVNMQTMQITLLGYDQESYSQGIIKELLGLEAPPAPKTEGTKRMPQPQHKAGDHLPCNVYRQHHLNSRPKCPSC